MADFIWVPDYSASMETTPKTSVVQFGDGYEQRQAYGLNTLRKSWSLTFNNRSDLEADAIEDFFEARQAVGSFTWRAPGDSEDKKWVCSSWRRQEVGFEVSSISCTFREVFEP